MPTNDNVHNAFMFEIYLVSKVNFSSHHFDVKSPFKMIYNYTANTLALHNIIP